MVSIIKELNEAYIGKYIKKHLSEGLMKVIFIEEEFAIFNIEFTFFGVDLLGKSSSKKISIPISDYSFNPQGWFKLLLSHTNVYPNPKIAETQIYKALTEET